MKRVAKICKSCFKLTFLFSHGHCKACWSKQNAGKTKKITPKLTEKRKKDHDTYSILWSQSDKTCEECKKYLGDEPQPFMFSHILSKGAHPKIRHDADNFNLLCFNCHQAWEFGDKASMKIYEKNKETIEMLKQKYYGKIHQKT